MSTAALCSCGRPLDTDGSCCSRCDKLAADAREAEHADRELERDEDE